MTINGISGIQQQEKFPNRKLSKIVIDDKQKISKIYSTLEKNNIIDEEEFTGTKINFTKINELKMRKRNINSMITPNPNFIKNSPANISYLNLLEENAINNSNSPNKQYKLEADPYISKAEEIIKLNSDINLKKIHHKKKISSPIKQLTALRDFKNNNPDTIPYIKSFEFRTKEGMTIQKKKKVNQDSLLVLNRVLGLENFSIFSVLDGHGMNGHFVSDYVKNTMRKYLTRSELYYIPRTEKNTCLTSLKNLTTEREIYYKLKEYNYEIIKKTIAQIESEIITSSFDVDFSGTTLCSIIHIDNKLICSNIGDSRAILVNEIDNKREIIELTKDHKPEINAEKERIIKKGGVVDKIDDGYNKVGPYRVWVKDESYPGLAMSRSIGDFVAKSIGVTSDPGMFYL